jgi:prepilin-type processing-associated H-X9-DG protein
MKIFASRKAARALTLIEVLIIVAVLMLLAAVFLPALAKPKKHAPYIICVNNLKQVGLAFKIWAEDNHDQYPMQVSVTNGGTMELREGPNAYLHFQVMSNELNSPMLLFCPKESDPRRECATTFAARTRMAGQVPFTGNSNLSYFVGVDATKSNLTMFLAGDRNITNGTPIKNGLLELTTNRLAGWTAEMHVNQGNVCLADGSVQAFNTPGLRDALQNTGVTTNRLAMP